MYSRFSKKEIVALGITGMSTLLMGSVLFMASASTSTTEDFITGLETAFPAPAASTGTTTTTTTSTGTTTNTWNTSTGTSSNTNTTSGSNTGNNSSTTTWGNNTNNNTTTWGNNTSSNSNTTNSNTTSTQSQNTNTIQSAPTGLMQTVSPTTTTTTPVTTTTVPVFSNSTPNNSTGTAGGTNAGGTTVGSTSPSSNSTSAENVTSLGMGLNSASQCKLPAIKILQVEELDTKTIVRWREVIGAAGYDVLKKSQSGEFVFIERVTKPIYTAHLARGAVKYEDFKIAAVCWDTKSASMNTSEVTSVKTGPVQFLLLVILSMNIGAAIMLRRNVKKS